MKGFLGKFQFQSVAKDPENLREEGLSNVGYDELIKVANVFGIVVG